MRSSRQSILRTFLGSLVLFLNSAYGLSYGREPLTYLSTIENATLLAPSKQINAYSHFDLHFNLQQNHQRVRLTLQPNQDVISDDLQIQYLRPDGTLARSEPVVRLDHRIFRGEAWLQNAEEHWQAVGDTRITIKKDGAHPLFEGIFAIYGDIHHVQLRSNYMRTKHIEDPDAEDAGDEYMIVFRDSDQIAWQDQAHSELKRSLKSMQRTCNADNLQSNINATRRVMRRDVGHWGSMPFSALLGKRQIDGTGIPTGGNSAGVNLKNTIGNTQGCPSSRKVALIGVATDCSYTASFESAQAAHANVISQIASASSVYEKSFNITLGLRNLTVSDAACPGTPPAATAWNVGCDSNKTISDRLNLFSTWRAQSKDSNAYWTLLTACNTGSEVGLAWLGQLCVNDVNSQNGEVTSGANVVARTSNEWQVIAHESGHTFGAVHDCDSQTCASSETVNSQLCCPLSANTCNAGAKYIMNPSTGQGITDFSPCSIGNICSALGRNSVKSACLKDNRGVVTITGHQCGNGIVEEGEDCDCGGSESCGNNQCCDAQTCKFKNNAVCDDANEDCCKSCQFASANTVCRASSGPCDPQESCTGTSALCPADQFASDGTSCGNSSSPLECASGQCTSRDQQCKTLMGSYTTKNDTYACNSQDCQLSCASPEFGPGVCYSMQQNFLDGTTCGGGGKCNNGQCTGSSATKEIGSWIHDNRNLVIGICAGLGGLILLSIISCLFRRCRRPRRTAASAKGSLYGPSKHGHHPQFVPTSFMSSHQSNENYGNTARHAPAQQPQHSQSMMSGGSPNGAPAGGRLDSWHQRFQHYPPPPPTMRYA